MKRSGLLVPPNLPIFNRFGHLLSSPVHAWFNGSQIESLPLDSSRVACVYICFVPRQPSTAAGWRAGYPRRVEHEYFRPTTCRVCPPNHRRIMQMDGTSIHTACLPS